MSRSAEIVWLTQEPGSDPMGEFGAEPGASRDRSRRGAVYSYAGALLQPCPGRRSPAPPPEPAAADAPRPRRSFRASRRARGRPRAAAGAVVRVAGALALLALVQAPFVVLWALQAVNGPAPIAIAGGEAGGRVRWRFAGAGGADAGGAAAPARRRRPAARPPGSLSGFLRVDVAVPMRISEDGRLLGTTDVDRLMLPAGDHTLDLRNDELQFTTRQTVTINPGDTTAVQVRLPSAPLSINARPWAEAWIDGERVGDTPIGTLMRTIGRHEVVLRHPELGERRVPVVITLAQPARVSVDFRAGK